MEDERRIIGEYVMDETFHLNESVNYQPCWGL